MNVWRRWLIKASLLLALLPVGRATLSADSSGTAPDAVVGELTSASETELGAVEFHPEPAAVEAADVPAENVSAADVANLATGETSVSAAADELPEATSKPVILPAWRMLEPSYSSATPLPISGKAMYYNPGVMDTVIESRLKYDQIELCQQCVGFVAMLRYGDLNRKVWLQFGENRLEGPFHVVDAAATQHVEMLQARGWAVDVDHGTALRWNMRMPYVTIWDEPPLALVMANFTQPLHWSATLSPSDAFVEVPRSANKPLDDSHVVVKQNVELRNRTLQSFVDLAANHPPELYVK